MALGLHVAAHDAEDRVQNIVRAVGEEGGNDGVVGALVGSEVVGMRRVEGEARATVLEREAAAFWDDAAAKTTVGRTIGERIGC